MRDDTVTNAPAPSGPISGGFVTPYPQSALNGELGLTSEDIAHAIAVRHPDFLKDMRQRRYVDFLRVAGFELKEISSNRKGPGRKGKVFVFTTEAAKAVVASSRTEAGAGYLRYLLSCETAVPRLIAELAAAREKIAKLMAPKTRQIPGRGLVTVITKTLKVVDLFGAVHEEIVRERKLYDELSPAEQKAYKIQHRSVVMRAISALQDDDINPKPDDRIIH